MSITTSDEWLGEVAERAGLDRDAARVATEAVLEALGLRITAGEVHDLADRLPEPVREPLLRGARRFEPARRLSLREFLALVAGREHASIDEARAHTRAVLAALREAAGEKEFADTVAQLPREFAEVLPDGDAVVRAQRGDAPTQARADAIGDSPRPPGLPAGPAMGRVTQGVLFHRDPLGFLRRVQARYGAVFTLRMALVNAPMVVFTDPRAIGELMSSDPSAAHTGEARRAVLGIVPPRGILGADGEQHRAARDRVAALFTREALERHRDAMADIAAGHLDDWPQGRPFQMFPRMRKIALDIFVRLLLGVRDDGRATALVAATRRMLATGVNPPLPPPGEGDGAIGVVGAALFKRRRQPVERLLAAEIEERRAGGRNGVDAIGCMLRADPPLPTDQMLDELITLLMPAHESGPAGLTWVLDRLSREPQFVEHFVAAGDDDARKDAFVREALRLRPAVHSIMRRLIMPMQVAGHQLPPGVIATIPTVLVHRNAESFPQPDAFWPERSLAAAAAAADAAYVPFGGGARRCLGEPLTLTAIDSVLPTILRRLRLRPVSPQPERMVVRGTVAVPHRGALAVARER